MEQTLETLSKHYDKCTAYRKSLMSDLKILESDKQTINMSDYSGTHFFITAVSLIIMALVWKPWEGSDMPVLLYIVIGGLSFLTVFLGYSSKKTKLKNIDKKIFNINETINENDEKISIASEKLEEFKNKQKDKILEIITSEFDKDKNGIIDVVEAENTFMKLVQKNQALLIEREKEFGQKFIHPFIKLGDYLNDKRRNLQSIYNSSDRIQESYRLEELVSILRDEIHLYELLTINAINMLVSIVENDQITFYGIYEKFDKFNVFTTNHEKEVSSLLNDTKTLLSSVISEIRNLNYDMVAAIGDLSYQTEQTQYAVSSQLESIDSTLKVGNMISSINAYQSYKINQKTKGLS